MTTPRPLDTVPIGEVVDRVLARHDRAALARGLAADITAAADLVCSRFAAGGRLLVLATDTATATAAAGLPARFGHEYGFADGAVQVAGSADQLRPTPRDAVVVIGPGAGRVERVGSAGIAVVDLPAATPDDLRAALDALALAVAATLGHLHGDLPVDLVAGSDADRERVVTMVAEIADVDDTTARRAAVEAGYDVRTAVIALVGGFPLAEAAVLAANRRTLRDALTQLPRRLPAPGPRGSGGG